MESRSLIILSEGRVSGDEVGKTAGRNNYAASEKESEGKKKDETRRHL